MSRRSVAGNAAVLLAANGLAGVLNYGFQLRAASRLDLASYASLNVWMAWLNLAFILGTALQFASNFHPLRSRGLKRVGWALWILGPTVLALAPSMSLTGDVSLVLGALTLILGLAYHLALGQLQGRFQFLWLGLGIVIPPCIKFAVAFWPGKLELHSLWWAFPTSYSVTLVVLGFGVLALVNGNTHEVSGAAPTSSRKLRENLPSSLVLASAFALAPQLDLLNLTQMHSPEVVGQYVRASLFSKAIFFGASTLLQLALPYHIAEARGVRESGQQASRHSALRLWEGVGLMLCLVGALAFSWIGPWITSRFLGFEVTEPRWILLSCLSLTAWYGILQRLQVDCALGRWKRAAVILASVLLFSLGVQAIHPSEVTLYLAWATAVYVALGAPSFLSIFRPRQVRA